MTGEIARDGVDVGVDLAATEQVGLGERADVANADSGAEKLGQRRERPDLEVRGDGEVAFDWRLKPAVAMTMSVGSTGRLTFAWIIGHRSYTGTDWLDDGIPAPVTDVLSQLVE